MSSIPTDLDRRQAEAMIADQHFLTIAEAAALIEAGSLSPVELTETYLARIAALDDQLDSFVTVTGERARRAAQIAEAEIAVSGPRGPLHGIPYCLKDILPDYVASLTGSVEGKVIGVAWRWLEAELPPSPAARAAFDAALAVFKGLGADSHNLLSKYVMH